MESELYDEFGNYIGEEGDEALGEASATSGEDEEEAEEYATQRQLQQLQLEGAQEEQSERPSTQIILHEDKKYYPSAEEVYGRDVEALVQEEDTQPLSEPIIAPIKIKKFQIEEKHLPLTTYSKEFMIDLLKIPERVRNIAIIGQLHHGKTSFMDLLISFSHKLPWTAEKQERYTDIHFVERARGLSLKSTPMTLLLTNSKGKSNTVNFIDVPGHVHFLDEMAASTSLVDAVILVVDVVEGVMGTTELCLKLALEKKLPILLLLNKIDRLILELKLPPLDAYFKLKYIIDQLNTLLTTLGVEESELFGPEKGNVLFSSCHIGWVFSLISFSALYMEYYADSKHVIEAKELAKRLWGDIYYSPSSRKFSKTSSEKDHKRSFVHFVLEPLYKIYSIIVGEEGTEIQKSLNEIGITLKTSQLQLDTKPLLRLSFSQFFSGSMEGAVMDALEAVARSPSMNAPYKVPLVYTGPLDTTIAKGMIECDPKAPLMIYVTKLFPSTDASQFFAFGRVFSGTLRKGQTVRILGEQYFPEEDEEDSLMVKVDTIWIACARYKIEIEEAVPGALVLLEGVDISIMKTATITMAETKESIHIFRPLSTSQYAVVKVAIEPIHPTELPKMLEGIRKISKSYPALLSKVEESGEHALFGPGELYLDSVLYDLRKLYAEIDIKVADPTVRFCETVVDTSSIKCYAETLNHRNKLGMIAEPLDKKIATEIESGKLAYLCDGKALASHFQKKYGWDLLASRNIWAFGPPHNTGPNLLLNDTLSFEVDRTALTSVREHIVQGFQWGVREGPLCDEPIRNVTFKLTNAEIAPEPIYRGGAQLISTARRVIYSSFLMASPKLMEPMYSVEILAPADCVSGVYTVLARRRGHVTQDLPQPGSPLSLIKALLPVIDSFGFETDLRTHTQGAAFCQQLFDHWQVVPGDPLDKSIQIIPLEPSPAPYLARDFMLKTRRRKGLAEDVSVSKYFDDAMMFQLAQESAALSGLA